MHGAPAQAHEVEAVLPAEAVGARGAVVVEERGAVGDGDRFQEHFAEGPVPLRRSDRAARASATTVEAFFSASISSLTPAEELMVESVAKQRGDGS